MATRVGSNATRVRIQVGDDEGLFEIEWPPRRSTVDFVITIHPRIHGRVKASLRDRGATVDAFHPTIAGEYPLQEQWLSLRTSGELLTAILEDLRFRILQP